MNNIEKIRKIIDDNLKRNGYNFTTELIMNNSFYEVEERLSLRHYQIIHRDGFISDI